MMEMIMIIRRGRMIKTAHFLVEQIKNPKLNSERKRNIRVKFSAVCAACDSTDLGYITNLKLNQNTTDKKIYIWSRR